MGSGTFGGSGEQTLLYGTKFQVTDQKQLLPESAFIVQGQTPTGGESNDSEVNMAYVLGWKLANNWKMDSALRLLLSREGEDHFQL